MTPTYELDQVEARLGVPARLKSCHVVRIGDYFVEGHVPIEAIRKLLMERPSIRGIALPGMPSGSPGMGGKKEGLFVIYGVSSDGKIQIFARI